MVMVSFALGRDLRREDLRVDNAATLCSSTTTGSAIGTTSSSSLSSSEDLVLATAFSSFFAFSVFCCG